MLLEAHNLSKSYQENQEPILRDCRWRLKAANSSPSWGRLVAGNPLFSIFYPLLTDLTKDRFFTRDRTCWL